MPPSGYKPIQVNAVRDLLRSCARDLEGEAQMRNESILRALQREIRDIGGYIGERTTSSSQIGILELTRAFYEKVEKGLESSSRDYWTSVNDALNEIGNEVLQIHIEPESVVR